MAHASNDSHEVGHSHARQYTIVFGILIFMTIVTVAAARVDFGVLNFVIAMLIASVKAGLVALIFMHLKHENPLTWLYAAFPILLIFLLIGLLFLDEPLRTEPTGIREKTPLEMPWVPGAPGSVDTAKPAHH
jgi:cytochrome c oxidase subunit 4